MLLADGAWAQWGLVWGRRSMPLLGSLMIHGLALVGLSRWEAQPSDPLEWQVETVELTPEELARVPDLELEPEPSALVPPGEVGGWQGLPVPSQGRSREEAGAAGRWQLPPEMTEELPEQRSGRDLYERWRRQQAQEQRLQEQRDRRLEQQQRRREQQRRQQEQQGRRDRGGDADTSDKAEGRQGATQDQQDQDDQDENQQEQTQGTQTQTPTPSPRPSGNGADGTNGTNPPREVAGPLTQLPPVSGNPPAAGDRGQFTFDGRQVGTDAAGIALGNLLAETAPWGQRYGDQPMRDDAGQVPEGMQGAWFLVNEDKPLETTYRTPVALCSLSPAPDVVRLAVLLGPDGQRATGTPPEAFQPQVVTSSGYRALDDYAIAQLNAALSAQQANGKKRLTPFNGYGVFVYSIRYRQPAGICAPQGNEPAPNS